MTYQEQYKKAQKEKTTRNLTPEFFKWIKRGQAIVGKYVSFDTITSKSNQGKYRQYVFDTDAGAMKCHFGTKFDNEIGDLLVRGMIVRIEYQGKEDIGGGKSVNLFDVEVVAGQADDDEPDFVGDVPGKGGD